MKYRLILFNKKLLLLPSIIILLFLYSTKAYSWQPDSTLTGNWHFKSGIFWDFKKNTGIGLSPADSAEISITINPDGTVEGSIGDAKFVGCRIEKNRGRLGRTLNMRTDFIITKGRLIGKINAEDIETDRDFTIPFNLKENKLQGSFMVKKPWKYPYPMFPRLKMTKTSLE